MSEYIVKFHHDERGIVKTWDEVGELIRCKDCKHYQESYVGPFYECDLDDSYREENDYCSQAERKEQ